MRLSQSGTIGIAVVCTALLGMMGCGPTEAEKADRNKQEGLEYERKVKKEKENLKQSEERNQAYLDELNRPPREAQERKAAAEAKRAAELAERHRLESAAIDAAFQKSLAIPKRPANPLPLPPTRLVGKAVVVDVTNPKSPAFANVKSSSNLQSHATDPKAIFFFISRAEREVASYQLTTSTGIPGTDPFLSGKKYSAYRVIVTVRVMPANGEDLGSFRIYGQVPPESLSMPKDSAGNYKPSKAEGPTNYSVRLIGPERNPEWSGTTRNRYGAGSTSGLRNRCRCSMRFLRNRASPSLPISRTS